jgi:serine/threonine protein kinase
MISYNEFLNRRSQKRLSENEVQAILEAVLIQLVPIHRQGKAYQQISLKTLQRKGEQTVLLTAGDFNLKGSPTKDIYDLGLVALELLTGQVPSPRRTNPHWDWNDHCLVSDQLNMVLERMVTLEPSQRLSNASEVLTAMGLAVPPAHPSPKLNLSKFLIGFFFLLITTSLGSLYYLDILGKEQQARRTEAGLYLSNMIRGQQDFHTENSFFASRLEDLALGLNSETPNYSYSLIEIDKKQLVQMVALSKRDELKTYTAIVGANRISGNYSFIWILCGSDQPTRDFPPRHENANSCPPGYSQVGR